ncbi:unnamed protein product [Durusdinium trenchii]|uniref:Uncharacterized protein n=1 Tax=Durusdinium trenchii TaxID=1381693 RepID=A0ABP0NLU4_9DINO
MAVLEMLLGDWREESSANQIQVTHNLEKGYQVLVQRPGRRRGRRFAAYVGSDGNVYRGCYVLDPTESTRDRQLWRLRSDLNEAGLDQNLSQAGGKSVTCQSKRRSSVDEAALEEVQVARDFQHSRRFLATMISYMDSSMEASRRSSILPLTTPRPLAVDAALFDFRPASGHRCAWRSAKLGIVVGEHGLKLGDLAESISHVRSLRERGQRRGRRFAAYVGSDGDVYCGRYVLDLSESSRERQLWRLRSDPNQVSHWRCFCISDEIEKAEDRSETAAPLRSEFGLRCPECAEEMCQECPGRSSRSSSVVRLFVALAHHFATAHSRGAISTAVAPMDVAKVHFASKILQKMERMRARDAFRLDELMAAFQETTASCRRPKGRQILKKGP